jgi:hypothetical protein
MILFYFMFRRGGEKKGRNQNGKGTQFTGRIFKSGKKREDTCNYLHHERFSGDL